jgi:glycosyltransferase involved in cell wall biosynthesis
MKTLVFLTSQFPFGTGESFIATEYPYLAKAFDKILIIAQNTTRERTRVTSENTKILRYNPSTSVKGFFRIPNLILFNSKIIYDLIKEELSFRKSISYRMNSRYFSILLKRIIKVIQLRDFIRQTLSEESVSGSIVFYSYWLKTGAQAIALLDYKNSIKIARAHGSDVYEEKTESGYLPLLRFAANNLDAVFFASEDGKSYFEKRTKTRQPGFAVSYLGVTKPDVEITKAATSNKFVIVSCSNMIPLKRIDRIIQALAMVRSSRTIEWLHFGDGILKDQLERVASGILGSLTGISYRFMGYMPNEELLKYYAANQADLFVNVSSTEGLPVSIIEAQSFGIPVIATDTGGVREVVREGTGSLIPVDFSNEDLAKLIEYFSNLSDLEYKVIEENAIMNWNSHFNATSNYIDFTMKVSSIFDSREIQPNTLL